MSKRTRRRVLSLESSDEDEEKDGVRLPPKSRGRIVEVQKSCQQATLRGPSETGTKSRKKNAKKKTSYGTRRLEFVKSPAVITVDRSRERGAGASAELGDHQEQSVDHRLWVDKYAPRDVGELAVHVKKVAEVKEWLQGQLLEPYGVRLGTDPLLIYSGTHGKLVLDKFVRWGTYVYASCDESHLGSRVLILTGPAGVGKTAVVRTLADQLGTELCEWTTPAPEHWQEYSHHSATGGQYVSKLDEFEVFLERGRKMSALPLASNKHFPSQEDDRKMKMSKILMIDDIPAVNDEDHRERLHKILRRLAMSRNVPSIVVVTDEGYRVRERNQYEANVVEALEGGGAKKIAFNPVTVNAMRRLLSKVQLLERCKLPPESLSAIAESSAGDIRQALTSLQFLSAGYNSRDLHSLTWDPGGLGHVKSIPNQLQNDESSFVNIIEGSRSYATVMGGRDQSLSLFHALGKFLHNKRRTNEVHSSDECSSLKLKEEFKRNPLDMEEPESVLLQAHSETPTILAFLHENVLQFVDENSIDDVAVISAYMSDTDCLLGTRGGFRLGYGHINTDDFEPSQIAIAAASSVAARGVLFGNGHPAPRRWQSLRAPGLWRVESQKRLKKGLYGSSGARGCTGWSVQATELYPFSQLLFRDSPSSSSAKISASDENFSVEVFKERNEPEAHLDDQTGLKRYSEVESTFMLMSVEDDIEDPDDSP